MRICIPVETKEGLEAKVSAHFGSARYFLIYDTDKSSFEILDNTDKEHLPGGCRPLGVLENQDIDAVVCIGMGIRAVQELKQGGIRGYKGRGGKAIEIVREYRKGKLEEITIHNACLDHDCH